MLKRCWQRTAACPWLMQVLASVFGPKQPSSRATGKHGMATVRCEYAMAPFSTGESAAAHRLCQTARPASVALWPASTLCSAANCCSLVQAAAEPANNTFFAAVPKNIIKALDYEHCVQPIRPLCA